jgi:DNA-directed RNA polymerase specialized sigma24 family protein
MLRMTTAIADLIAPQLSSLRLFARALTGSQERGDSYVIATLESLVADGRLFRRDLAPKTAAFHAFVQVWDSLPMNRRREPVEASATTLVDRRIETLTPRPRQAFLLAALEEFSTRDIAEILATSEAEVRALVDTAGREISEQIAARVLIIEDEPLISLDLEGIVTEIGHDVVGIAQTRDEAVELASENRPGLVLADVQLADGSSGIDAVSEILHEADIPVIFITAYPERLLTGEGVEPTFLLSKPFRPEMVKAVISQALFFDMKASRINGGAAA